MSKSFSFLWIIAGLGACTVFAETVPEAIKKAGLQDTIGTTPDQAGAADSLAFSELPPRTYWMTKHTFRIATDAWNNQRIEESKGGSKPPLVLSDIFRDMLLNEYLHALDRAWTGITTEKYGAGAARKKRLITEGDPEAVDVTQAPAPSDAPNARLASHIRAYYDAWLIEKHEDIPSIYQRFVGSLLSGGGAPLLGSSRDYAVFDAKIADTGGQLAQGSKLTLRVARKNLWGDSTQRTYYTNPVRLAVPCATYEVEATAEKLGAVQEAIEFVKGANVTRAYQLPARAGGGSSTSPLAAIRWTNQIEAEELRRWYIKKLGTEAIVPFNPTKVLEQLSSLPTDHGKIMATYGFAGRWGSPWRQNARRVSRVDGTGGAPNPAINDPCLNIAFDLGAVDAAKIGSTPGALRREVATAVVEWANAFIGESEAANEPLTSFAINGEFFSRLAFRARAERSSAMDMPAEAVASANVGATTIRCSDFVTWDREAFNTYVQAVPSAGPKAIRPLSAAEISDEPSASSKPLGRADEVIDLTFRFVPQFTIRNVAPDAVAVFNNTTNHHGIVEILLKPEWRFIAEGEPRPQGQFSKLFAFRNIVLHELGHYFGLPHLPEPHSGHSFLDQCVMRANYSSTFGAVTPADAAMVNAFEYLSLDVKGRICDGLGSK